MTEYIDVPAANALHAESQQIILAISNIDAGGTVVSMTIAPPPPVIPEPGDPGAPPPVPMLMSVNVAVPPPVDPALTAQIRSWMDQRLLTISDEMTALGVVVPPVTSMASVQQSLPSSLPQWPPMSVLVPPITPSTIPPAAPTPRMPEPPTALKEE